MRAGKLDIDKLPPDLIEKIPAMAEIAQELARPCDESIINVHLTNVLRLIGMSAHLSDRADWIEAMIDAFKNEPGNLVIEAINEVSKNTSALWDFHRKVSDYIKPEAKYLKNRATDYHNLMLMIENRKL